LQGEFVELLPIVALSEPLGCSIFRPPRLEGLNVRVRGGDERLELLQPRDDAAHIPQVQLAVLRAVVELDGLNLLLVAHTIRQVLDDILHVRVGGEVERVAALRGRPVLHDGVERADEEAHHSRVADLGVHVVAQPGSLAQGAVHRARRRSSAVLKSAQKYPAGPTFRNQPLLFATATVDTLPVLRGLATTAINALMVIRTDSRACEGRLQRISFKFRSPAGCDKVFATNILYGSLHLPRCYCELYIGKLLQNTSSTPLPNLRSCHQEGGSCRCCRQLR
jgi:hypothetical protein